MTDDSFSNSQTFTTKKTLERRSIYDSDNNSINNNKSRKFRWSSCFSFITKFKKPKSQKIRLSQSFEDFDQKDYVPENNLLPETIQVVEVKPSTSTLPWKQQQQPSSSLSPPPRHIKTKRNSSISHKNYQSENDSSNTTRGGRRPLVDPTLTPRVKPRSIKTKKQPSLLRLSLDAELLQQSSPDGVFSLHDNESISTCKTGHSSASFTPTTTTQLHPFRSGTLGAMKNPNKLSMSSIDSEVPPPLPQINIPLEIVINSSSDNTRPNSQSTTNTDNSNISHLADSPVSINAVEAATTDDKEKLTLKERRHRRSPLSMPDTEQLTLALKDLLTAEQQPTEEEEEVVVVSVAPEQKPLLPRPQPRKRQSQPVYYENGDEGDHVWRQQLLEQSIAFSFQDKSRQEAMLTLEGKKSQTLSLQPIVNIHDLDDHFDKSNNDNKRAHDVVRDKAQYDAIVSRTTMHRRQLSHDERRNTYSNFHNNNRTSLRARSPSDSSTNEKKILLQHQNEMLVISSPPVQQQQLDIITENEIATTTTTTTPISANKMLLFPTNGSHLSVTPETPPHHQQNAPSLISAPSTPNSIDSSVLDHDDYMSHAQHQHHHLTLVQSFQ